MARCVSDAVLLVRSQRLLERFRADARLLSWAAFVREEEDLLVSSSRSLVEKMSAVRPLRFNPFFSAGFAPNENAYNRVLASYLDPREHHGLGTSVLIGLLELLKNYAEKWKKEPDRILARLARETSGVVVERNYYVPAAGRPDIVVFGEGEPSFIIVLENKVWGGSEGDSQTNRYAEWLESERKRRGVSPEFSFAVYLSPQGALPANRDFIPISWGRLADAVQRVVRAGHNPDDCYLTRSFFETFSDGGFR